MRKRVPKFIAIAISKEVVFSSLKVSLVVGTLLAFINYGEAIVQNALDKEQLQKIALTYLVPYLVSTYASVKSIQKHSSRR